ncbi:hypothetical protein OH768_00045 [Streptomyces sp. NBC_01622]|uniref:hypothetical protein n=1 Tax=Streptomyces sp. NBC_01622 TaxID=2975903 RepID=UPI0038686AF6|nr:hypothetical protein OH768_00045 [Streptomyces sp. NBC_01622]
MPARPRPARRHPARQRPARTATTVLLLAPAGRTALAYVGAALLLLLALTAALALGAAYAPRPAHRTAARHTLHLLLRLAPWYPDSDGERTGEGRGET